MLPHNFDIRRLVFLNFPRFYLHEISTSCCLSGQRAIAPIKAIAVLFLNTTYLTNLIETDKCFVKTKMRVLLLKSIFFKRFE